MTAPSPGEGGGAPPPDPAEGAGGSAQRAAEGYAGRAAARAAHPAGMRPIDLARIAEILAGPDAAMMVLERCRGAVSAGV